MQLIKIPAAKARPNVTSYHPFWLTDYEYSKFHNHFHNADPDTRKRLLA